MLEGVKYSKFGKMMIVHQILAAKVIVQRIMWVAETPKLHLPKQPILHIHQNFCLSNFTRYTVLHII